MQEPLLVYFLLGARGNLLHYQCLKGKQHKMLPMYITTILRPVSRILPALIASFASCPYRTSCELFLSSKLARVWHPCCRWQAMLYCSGHIFFFFFQFPSNNHSTHCKSKGLRPAFWQQPTCTAGAWEAQRTWDTIYFMPHLGSPWCSNLHQMSADTISKTQVANARDPCDQLHSQSWSKNFCNQGVADFMVRQIKNETAESSCTVLGGTWWPSSLGDTSTG